MSWVEEQKQSGHHKVAIYLFPIVIFLGYLHPAIFGVGLFLFFIITSFKLLKSMLLWMLILGGISLLIPFLAPVIFIIMIILFFMRISYVFKNWRPFSAGIFLYGVAGALIGRSTYYYTYGVNGLIEGAIVSVISFIAIRQLLLWLYQHHYTSYAALGIMGSVPVIIISFILPFLKLHIGGDFFVSDTAVETKPTTGSTYGDAYTETKLTTSEPITSRTPMVTEQPLVYVNDHIRTAPDGDVRNNLSYQGPDKTAPNPNVVHVNDHVRTAPDGIESNNLSYQGNTNYVEQNSAENPSNNTEDSSEQHHLVNVAQNVVSGQVAVDQLIRKLKDEED